MPFLGVGVHILIALFFAVHAVRTGKQLFWLLILFSFPLIGSVVYFLAIYLPQSRLERTIGLAGRAVAKRLDPGRDLREASDAFALTPTAHNQTRLAAAMLEAGMSAQAVEQFDACLQGPFANDPDIRLGAARARLANGQAEQAAAMLKELRRTHPAFRAEAVGLALAQSFATAGMRDQAGAEYAYLVEHFPSVESRVEYAIWALSCNDQLAANAQLQHVDQSRKHMSRHARDLHSPLFKRLDEARKQQRADSATA